MSSLEEDCAIFRDHLAELDLKRDLNAIADRFDTSVRYPAPREKAVVRAYIEQRFDLVEELIKKGQLDEATFHLANAIVTFDNHCHFQPLRRNYELGALIPRSSQKRLNLYMDLAEQARDKQLIAIGQFNDDEEYDDDVFLRATGDASDDVCAEVARRLTDIFHPLAQHEQTEKLCAEQLGLSAKEIDKGHLPASMTHLMNALICYCDREHGEWPAPLYAAFKADWVGKHYDRQRLITIAKARRQLIEDYHSGPLPRKDDGGALEEDSD